MRFVSKKLFPLCLLFIVLLITSCANSSGTDNTENNTPENGKENQVVDDYFMGTSWYLGEQKVMEFSRERKMVIPDWIDLDADHSLAPGKYSYRVIKNGESYAAIASAFSINNEPLGENGRLTIANKDSTTGIFTCPIFENYSIELIKK